MYIRQYTSPNKNFKYGYTNSNGFLQSHFKLERCKQHKAYPKKCDVINDIKLFPTVFPRKFDFLQLDLCHVKKSSALEFSIAANVFFESL